MGFVTPDLSSVAQKLPQPEQPAIQQAGSTAPQNPPVMLGQPADQPQQQQPQQPQQDPRIEALRQRYIQQATPPPPPTGGPVRQALQGFFKGMEQNMLARVGVPTDLQKQQNALHNLNMLDASQNTMAATRATIAQHTPSVPMMDIEGKPVMGTDGNPILMAPIHAETYYQGLNQQRVLLGVQALKNASINPNLTPDQAAAIGHPELANQPFGKAFGSMLAQQAGKVLITPDMVQKYNMPPEAEGKYAKMSDILSAERLTMTRQTQQWKPDGLGGYIPVTATSTRTFGNNAPVRGGAGGVPTSAAGPTGPQSIPGKGPIYAFDPRTNDTVMTTQQEAQQNGYTNPRKVSQVNIEADRQLNNRLYDVAAKVQRYEQSMNEPITDLDRAKIADLIGNDKLQFGAFGAHIPTDWLTKLTQATSTAGMSPAAQKRLINYYNVREAMTGYTRVLTGSGRSNETNLQLNLQAMPDPVMPDNFTKQGIGQFKQNIQIAGQGLPRMPGIQRAQDVFAQDNNAPPIRFTEGADQYDIPADKVPAFKAKHPQAVPSGR